MIAVTRDETRITNTQRISAVFCSTCFARINGLSDVAFFICASVERVWKNLCGFLFETGLGGDVFCCRDGCFLVDKGFEDGGVDPWGIGIVDVVVVVLHDELVRRGWIFRDGICNGIWIWVMTMAIPFSFTPSKNSTTITDNDGWNLCCNGLAFLLFFFVIFCQDKEGRKTIV